MADAKQIGIVAACVAAIGGGLFLLAGSVGGPDQIADASRKRTLIDMVSGEVFEDHPLMSGMDFPMENPKTGERSLMPAEKCYWTRDGKYKPEPTYVLLKEHIGESGTTICPDCGREVVGRNPLPPDELIAEFARNAQAADD